MTSQQTVAVTCATGDQGKAVTLALAKAGYQVRALTRSPDSAPANVLFDGIPNVKLHKADYNDIASIEKAFQGVDIVFANTLGSLEESIAPPGSNFKRSDLTQLEQGKRYADAAAKAGVKLFVWSTLADAKKLSGGKYVIDDLVQSKIQVQDHVQQIGLPALFVECGWYFENLISYQLVKLQEDGSIQLTWSRANADDQAFPETYVEADWGRAVALLIQNYSDSQKYQVVRIFERNFSIQEIVDEIAKVTGRKVVYEKLKYYMVEGCPFDQMIAFYVENYPRHTEIDPALKALDFKFTPLETFVKEKIVHFLGL